MNMESTSVESPPLRQHEDDVVDLRRRLGNIRLIRTGFNCGRVMRQNVPSESGCSAAAVPIKMKGDVISADNG
jgi:hypothetical protein